MKIKTMQAAILVEQNKPLVVDEVELPNKLDCGQVLVKVNCSGICGSQLGEIAGVKGQDPYLPHLLGHEGSGIVMKRGSNVVHVKEGDHVVMHWRPGSGIKANPPKYKWKGKTLNAGYLTTFNEYAIVSGDRLSTIPKDFDLEIGALMGCAVTTGLGVINNDAKVKIGESVVVWGAGGIGLNIIQGAALVSANPIIAIDLYDHKLQLAKKMGASHTFNAKETNPENEVLKIVGKNGADVVIDNTGNVEIIQSAYQITSNKGITILVGVPPKGDKAKLYTLPLHFDKVLTGSHGGETIPDIDIPNYIKLYRNGGINLKQLITHHYSLKNINEAIENMRNGTISGRCIINCHSI